MEGEIDENVHTGNTREATENEDEANCVTAASYETVVYCADCGAELSRTPVEGDVDENVHTGNTREATENVQDATCTEGGSYDTVIYCADCGAELARSTTETGELGHKPGTPVKENESAATCTDDGSYEEVVYCTRCGEELSRTPKTSEATGHKWKAPTWSWSADYSAATATFVCANDGTHVETKEAVITTSAVEPTCTAAGKLTFKATVTGPDGKTYTSEKSESIDALGHDYDENGVCTRCGDGGDCPWCGQHHNRKTIVGWWTELVHHVLYIINRIFLWWSAIAK